MKNNTVKYFMIGLGIIAVCYGTFRIAEYFMGVVRLKYSVITIKKYDINEVDQTPIE